MKAPKKPVTFVTPETASSAATVVNVYINGIDVARLAGNQRSLRIEAARKPEPLEWLPAAFAVAKWLVRVAILVYSLVAGSDVVASILGAVQDGR